MRHIAVCKVCGNCITTSDWMLGDWDEALWSGACERNRHRGLMIPMDCGYLVVFEEQEFEEACVLDRCCGECGKSIVGVPYVPGESVGARHEGLIWAHQERRVFCDGGETSVSVTPQGLMVMLKGTEVEQ